MLLRRALAYHPRQLIRLVIRDRSPTPSSAALHTMPHSTTEDRHEAKRPRLDQEAELATSATKILSKEEERIQAILDSEAIPESTARVSFREGLFLAPMVRIGSLPTRLLSLRYGADLVWSPEIVDRAIMGSDRVVDERTGMVSFLREGKQIFTTHPIERDRLIFQLGSASPRWAYEAISHVTAHDDVAGVDLNCGCPKPFSTIGGMGAQLLSTPDLLCSILKAMRKAAPPHIAVSCKIRLLPTKEATQSLVRQIIRTGTIDALTVHCRTKDMRPREKALTSRFEEVRQVVEEETGGKLPLIINGDAWDAKEAAIMMKATGVKAVMIARGAEGNPSCFRDSIVESVPEVIAPAWIRLALTFDNNYGNTKYCINSMAFKPSSCIVPNARPLPSTMWNKQRLAEVRCKVSQAKSVEEIALALEVDVEAERQKPVEVALLEVKTALEERYHVDGKQKQIISERLPLLEAKNDNSNNVLEEMEGREMTANVV